MQQNELAVTSDLVLVGGGHSHLFVLKYFAMNPVPGVRLTLVSRDLHTPYSGMLPGFIAGHYKFDDAHIDLLPLARYAGARVIHDEVTGLDAERGRVQFANRPELDYDLLSINIGSRPTSPPLAQTDDLQFAVKPVDRFIESWERLERRLLDSEQDFKLAVIGGGAAGVELALSLDYRARQLQAPSARLELRLVTDRPQLLPGHNARVRRMFGRILEQRAIPVHYDFGVSCFEDGLLRSNHAATIAADAAIWVTQASPAGWLQESGLKLDDRGFIAVTPCLQSVSHDNLFAAGDIASVGEFPRPKSGVFAVRQGLPLARNLQRWLRGRRPRPFKPQRQFLSLISTGDRFAVASRGPWALQGNWCWWLKDRIDRKFVRRFTELPPMQAASDESDDLAPMRCGGCGSKVGSEILDQVLAEIGSRYAATRGSGFEHADDAALIRVPAGLELVQSVDHFRSFIDDPYLFGRIAANHALGDLFAMGVDPHSALVIANVVFASEARQAQDLYQLMSGVAETLAQHNTLLVGGHSGEASQMSCGLSVNGFARPEELLLKSGMRPGDMLILTRALGSGVLFAAEMRGQARAAWIDAALEQMLVSSRAAAACLRSFGASACTDVTGFGLAGHLLEMARASGCGVEILLQQLPLYPGAAELARCGIESSLKPQNVRIRHAIRDRHGLAAHDHYPLIFDPQTAGGLLASVAPEVAQDCLQQLWDQGYTQARIVARAVESVEPGRILNLVRT
jgi:selenide,water dikinase